MAKKQESLIDGVIYARYSEGPNQTEASIEGQVRECKEYAERNGIRIINVYSDSKHTGTNDNRAAFQKMLRDSKRSGFSVVIVWKIDRFGRNRAEIAQNKAILKLSGVKVISAMEHIPDTPEGIILESVLEGMAEYYSANLAENVKRGLKENALQCKSNGAGQSLGYIVGDDKRYKIEPNEAAIVQMIFQKYDEGMKIADIWRELVEKGIKTKRNKDFTQYGISRILSNRAYIGEYRYADIITPGGMPRIIDDDLFNRVQERREKNKKAPASHRSNSEVNFLLTGKLFCGGCKSTMRGDCGTSKNGQRFYFYVCHGKRYKKNGCKMKNVRKEWLEKEVTRITVEYILTESKIEFIASKVIELQEKEQADKSMLCYYEQQLREIQRALSNLLKAIEAGLITSTTKNRLFELEDQKARLETEIEREKIVHPTLEKEQIIFFLERFKGGDINSKEYQQAIIDAFVNKVILYNDKIIITYNVSSDNNEISAEIVEKAAFETEYTNANECSAKLPSSPPFAEKSNTMYNIFCWWTFRNYRKNPQGVSPAGFRFYAQIKRSVVCATLLYNFDFLPRIDKISIFNVVILNEFRNGRAVSRRNARERVPFYNGVRRFRRRGLFVLYGRIGRGGGRRVLLFVAVKATVFYRRRVINITIIAINISVYTVYFACRGILPHSVSPRIVQLVGVFCDPQSVTLCNIARYVALQWRTGNIKPGKITTLFKFPTKRLYQAVTKRLALVKL